MSSKTSFWKIAITLSESGERQEFLAQAPAEYSEERVCSLIGEVHPEYASISGEQVDRPEWATAWSD